MRIGVCGTHSVGKSTLVSDFVERHSTYVREEEPYRVLREFYPIKFGKESSRYDNGIQLYYSLSRVKQYSSSEDRVIFDRSPVDYIAYSLYTAHFHQTDIDKEFVLGMVGPVRQALQFLDLLLFIPLSREHPMRLQDDGIRLTDHAYRTEVDHIFKQILHEGLYDLFPDGNRPRLIEIQGSREERLAMISELL